MEELQKRLQQLSEEYQKLQTGTPIRTPTPPNSSSHNQI